MKIIFLPFIKYHNMQSLPLKHGDNSGKVPQNSTLPEAFYLPPGFGRTKVENELLTLQGLHCPVCGVKTLSKEEYNKLVEQSRDIKNPEEYIDFLQKNKEYIPKVYSKIIKHAQVQVNEHNVKTMDELFAALSRVSKSRVKTYLKRSAESFLYMAEHGDFSDSDREKLQQSAQELIKPYKNQSIIKKYPYYSELINRSTLSMDSPRKRDISYSSRANIKEAFLYNMLFAYDNSNTPCGNRTEQITAKIFQPVLAKTGKIFENLSNNYYEDVNNIFLCAGCEKSQNSVLGRIRKNPDSVLYLNRYFQELADLIADNAIALPASYALNQAKNIKKMTGCNIDIHALNTVMKNKIFEERHNNLDFEILNFENVPCACCGITTMTHKQKMKLMDEILSAQDDEEVFKIIENNKKYLRPEFLEILDEYEYIYHKFPNFSQKDIIDILQKKMSMNMDIQLMTIVDVIKYKAGMLNLSENDKKLVSKFINKTKTSFINKEFEKWFPYKDYNILIDETLLKMDSEKKYNLANKARGEIRNKHILETILYVHPNILQKMSPLKGMVQNMFKYSVITADHVIPRDRRGGNERSNIAAFCKFCNQKKSDMLLKDFYRFNPEIKLNMQKYIDRVVELIKTGELKGYEDYPAKFANIIRWQTRFESPIILRFSGIEKKNK